MRTRPRGSGLAAEEAYVFEATVTLYDTEPRHHPSTPISLLTRMHTSPPSLPEPPSRISRDIDLGCRLGFLVLTAILTYAAIYLSWRFFTLNVSTVVDTMFKGQPLPTSLIIAESGRSVWFPLSCALPLLAAIAGLSVRRPLPALLIIAGCNLVLAIIALFLATALLDGIGKVISTLA